MLSKVHTAVLAGIEGRHVVTEADLSNGLPHVHIVGLAGTTVMESRERIRSAIVNSGFEYPRHRVTINLTPAALHKAGTHLDLPIAVSMLAAMRYLDTSELSRFGVIGELSLDGRLLPVDGVLPMVIRLSEDGIRRVLVPTENAKEAAMVQSVEVFGAKTLRECVEAISQEAVRESCRVQNGIPEPGFTETEQEDCPDFADIRGQANAKRALTIAAAGNHGVLMIGSPGCGKTMLAKRIPGILPEMSKREILEDTIIYSVMGKIHSGKELITRRPFRMPHHSIGRAGLLGGGLYPVPGEITLAHNGVLFLDEVCEFDRDTLEALRIPLEDRTITHSRMGVSYRLPCSFLPVLAANPCKCGYYGDPDRECTCSQAELLQYQRKLSGPLLDRIDLEIRMEKVVYQDIASEEGSRISSAEMRGAVLRAQEFARRQGRNVPNGLLPEKMILRACRLGKNDSAFLEQAYRSLHLSPRSYMRTLRTARTIADLDCSIRVTQDHLAEALSYRLGGEVS